MKRFTMHVPRARDSCTSYAIENTDYLTILYLMLLFIISELYYKKVNIGITIIGVIYNKLYLNNTIVLKVNIIDVLNNYIIAIITIAKCPYLLGNKTTLNIRHKTTRFKSIYTKS